MANDKLTAGAESVERKKTIKSGSADDETRACAKSELMSKFNRAGEQVRADVEYDKTGQNGRVGEATETSDRAGDETRADVGDEETDSINRAGEQVRADVDNENKNNLDR